MNDDAVGFVSLARIPTVTSPCLKSILSGSHPVFFELVENIDESGVSGTVSTGPSQDNLLQRLKRKGKSVAVYGDDIWGKLFPLSLFDRHKLSFGFNIMDYTEVDNLVHDSFEAEKNNPEGPSDVIILHYLGLDHIGHSFEAKDEYVRPKLKEMDEKIAEIYEWTRIQDEKDGKKTLILMMGDHGMTHDGNHGGGSKEEIQAAAVFLSSHFTPANGKEWSAAIKEAEEDSHHQEDLAATISALLDGSSPLKFGNGCLIERVMRALNDPVYERIQLLKNLKHLIGKLGKQVTPEINDFSAENLYKISEEIKGKLNTNTFTFDEPKLKAAILVLGLVSIFHLIKNRRGFKINLERIATLISMSVLSVCQEATSFIGEEHLIWQGAFLANFLVFLVKCCVNNKERDGLFYKGVKILLLHRLLCGWNGIGTMWVNEKTLGTYVKGNDYIEAALVAAALIWILYKEYVGRTRIVSMLPCVVASALVFVHRAIVANHLLAQSVLVILVSEHLVNRKSLKSTTIAILSVLLNKPANAMPVALLLELATSLNSMNEEVGSFLKLCTIQCAFYALGLWNSVSAIDLTFGAVFSEKFNMRVAPVVLLLYTLSGPILVSTSLRRNDTGMILVMRSVLDFAACAFAYKHRFHPWIFNFYSPKILFQVFWSAFYFLLLPLIGYM